MLLPTPAPTADEAAARAAHAVRVAFVGPLRGCLALRVTDDVARACAENMLGAEPQQIALVRDALGEVANVVCGNLLPELAGRDAVFHLDAPQPMGADDAAWAALGISTLAASLGVDGGRADLALHVEAA